MHKGTQNTASNSEAKPALVDGKAIGVEGTRIRIQLDSGVIGFVAMSGQVTEDTIRVGQRATFRIVSPGESNGAPILAFAEHPATAPIPQESFDRDIVRLRNALANHHPSAPTNSAGPVEHIRLGEEQIRSWMARVETGMDRLRRNRAKRLDEEFYNGS